MQTILGLAALELGLMMSTGLVYGRSSPRKIASLSLALMVPVVPWLLPVDQTFLRGLFAVFSLIPIFKWIQLTADGHVGTPLERIWQWTAIFDVRRAEPAPPRWDPTLAVHTALYAALGAIGAGLAAWGAFHDLELPRLVGGVLAVVGLVQGVIDVVQLVHAGLGVRVPPIHREPLASVSVREFWGRRWNRTVSDWLRRHVFEPLARRNAPALGLFASFAVSAAFHFYIVLVPLGLIDGLVMATFFLVQYPVVLLERRLVAGRPRAVRRAFAMVALLATSPLFTLPFTEVLVGGLP